MENDRTNMVIGVHDSYTGRVSCQGLRRFLTILSKILIDRSASEKSIAYGVVSCAAINIEMRTFVNKSSGLGSKKKMRLSVRRENHVRTLESVPTTGALQKAGQRYIMPNLNMRQTASDC